jgi:hypothetical protein
LRLTSRPSTSASASGSGTAWGGSPRLQRRLPHRGHVPPVGLVRPGRVPHTHVKPTRPRVHAAAVALSKDMVPGALRTQKFNDWYTVPTALGGLELTAGGQEGLWGRREPVRNGLRRPTWRLRGNWHQLRRKPSWVEGALPLGAPLVGRVERTSLTFGPARAPAVPHGAVAASRRPAPPAGPTPSAAPPIQRTGRDARGRAGRRRRVREPRARQ